MTSWPEILTHARDLLIAYVLVLPVGWNRERDERSAGLRTFPLVAMASCGFVLLAVGVLGRESTGQARILEGLIAGIGFIGGGAILKAGHTVRGTATAASLLTTGVVGGAVGYGLYDIAAILAVMNFVTLNVSVPLKRSAAESALPSGSRGPVRE